MNWLIVELCGFFILIVLSGLFSSTEVAYTGLTVGQLKRIRRVHKDPLQFWEENSDRVLATLLLSNSAVNTGVGVLTAHLAVEMTSHFGWRQPVSLLCLSVLSGFFLLIFGEIIPKVWAKQFASAWALRTARLMKFWVRLLYPLSGTALAITRVIMMGQYRRTRKSLFLKKEEMERILVHSAIPSGSRKILDNLIDFSSAQVKDIMIPRAQIISVSKATPMARIIQEVIESGLSRIPVHTGSLDQVIGVLYAKDLLVAWRSGTLIVLDDLLRPVSFVPPDLLVPDLVRQFRTGHYHMALVRDPQTRHVQGMVTLQDSLEAIVGEIIEER